MDAFAFSLVQHSHVLVATVGIALTVVPFVVYAVFREKEVLETEEMLVDELPKLPRMSSMVEEAKETTTVEIPVVPPPVVEVPKEEPAVVEPEEEPKAEDVVVVPVPEPEVVAPPAVAVVEEEAPPMKVAPLEEEPAVEEVPATFTEPTTTGYRISVAESQGERKAMEDAHFVVDGEKAIVGVFDGCGGNRASTFARDKIAELVKTEQDLSECIAKTEKATLVAARKSGNWPDACAVVLASVTATSLDVAWLGDSRAVLATESAVECLTRDHNAADSTEEKRIKLAGGKVARNLAEAQAGSAKKLLGKFVGPAVAFKTHAKNPKRVFPGAITLTRCIGALPLKYAKPQLVIADAETVSLSLDGTEKFLVLASDGVFEHLSDAAVAQACDDAIAKNLDPADALINAVAKSGSKDNITAIVVNLRRS